MIRKEFLTLEEWSLIRNEELIKMFLTTVSYHDVGNVVLVTILPSSTKSESMSLDVEDVVQEGQVLEATVETVLRSDAAVPNGEDNALEEDNVANDPLNSVVFFVEVVVKFFELEVEVVVEANLWSEAVVANLLVVVLRKET